MGVSMGTYVLSVGNKQPIHIEIMNAANDVVVNGQLNRYRLDYDMETSAAILRFSLQGSDTVYSLQLGEADTALEAEAMTPQEIFFTIVNFLGELIHKAKSFGRTLAMKLDDTASRVYVKDLLQTHDTYRVFNGKLAY